MLTVIVCLVGSGNISTRRPLARRYSVMPSTEVTFSGGAGAGAAAAGAGAGAGCGFGFFARAGTAQAAIAATITSIFDIVFMIPLLTSSYLSASRAPGG